MGERVQVTKYKLIVGLMFKNGHQTSLDRLYDDKDEAEKDIDFISEEFFGSDWFRFKDINGKKEIVVVPGEVVSLILDVKETTVWEELDG